MRQIATLIAAGLVAVSMAGCAVEVPMSAFRVGPLDQDQNAAATPQHDQAVPSDERRR